MSHRRRESHFSPAPSRTVDASLIGDPPYGWLLGNIFWDLGAFRPDPKEYMRPREIYRCRVQINVENLSSGGEVQVPREVELLPSGKRFVNIR